MSKDFTQTSLSNKEKTLEDFFKIRGGTLSLTGTLQTENFIEGKRGVQIKNEGLSAGSINIAGSTQDSLTTTIPGALKHTGNSTGFYNVAPIARQTVTLGNTNNEIGGLAISAAYSQAEVTALRDKCEELADDVRSLKAALAATGIIA
jgi:hypothetical protein